MTWLAALGWRAALRWEALGGGGGGGGNPWAWLLSITTAGTSWGISQLISPGPLAGLNLPTSLLVSCGPFLANANPVIMGRGC
jgi:hypothetical protein